MWHRQYEPPYPSNPPNKLGNSCEKRPQSQKSWAERWYMRKMSTIFYCHVVGGWRSGCCCCCWRDIMRGHEYMIKKRWKENVRSPLRRRVVRFSTSACGGLLRARRRLRRIRSAGGFLLLGVRDGESCCARFKVINTRPENEERSASMEMIIISKMKWYDDGTHCLVRVTPADVCIIESSIVLLRTILPNMAERKCAFLGNPFETIASFVRFGHSAGRKTKY